MEKESKAKLPKKEDHQIEEKIKNFSFLGQNELISLFKGVLVLVYT